MTGIQFELYRGFPISAGDTLAQMIEKKLLAPLIPNNDGFYDLQPGMYSCHIFGEDIYDTLKVFFLSEREVAFCPDERFENLALPITQYEEGKTGYQPTIVSDNPPEFFKRTQKDEMLCIWPDEILEKYASPDVPAMHQCMTQPELEHSLEVLNQKCACFHLFSLGKTKHYGYNLPLVILTKEKLEQTSNWKAGLSLLAKGEKTNILYQAQIHGNEVAAGEGAIEVLRWFAETEGAEEILEKINLIVVPRVNPEAAYLYRRMAYNNIDLNRDHMACDAWETRVLHQVFQSLLPEVVLDGHEFTFYLADAEGEKGYVKKGNEVMSSPGTSLNIDDAVMTAGFELCGRVFEDMKTAGWKINHFGTSEDPAFGRVYYGLHQCLSFLIETRGIGGGRYGMEKRVRAQKEIMLAYIRHVMQDSALIKKTVWEARERAASKKEIVLQHGATGMKHTPYCGCEEQYYLDGTLRGKTDDFMELNDLRARVRLRPEAYIIPADIKSIDAIIGKVEALGCRIEKLEPGTKMMAHQYSFVEQRPGSEHEQDILTDRKALQEYVFEKGAYVFTAEDFRAIPLSLLMEPDVTDAGKNKVSLFQQNCLAFDEETKLFPLYCI